MACLTVLVTSFEANISVGHIPNSAILKKELGFAPRVFHESEQKFRSVLMALH